MHQLLSLCTKSLSHSRQHLCKYMHMTCRSINVREQVATRVRALCRHNCNLCSCKSTGTIHSHTICLLPCPRLNHLLTDKFFKRRKCHHLSTSASNQLQLRNQHLDCEPLSGWEGMGHSTASLKRNSCKLQIGKPLWEAALPFVVSFLLSSKCWHADVCSHFSCVITKMGWSHKRMLPQYGALYCMEQDSQRVIYMETLPQQRIRHLTPLVKLLNPFQHEAKRRIIWLKNNQCDQPWWYYTFHSSGRAVRLCLCAERSNGPEQIRILIRACAGVW